MKIDCCYNKKGSRLKNVSCGIVLLMVLGLVGGHGQIVQSLVEMVSKLGIEIVQNLSMAEMTVLDKVNSVILHICTQ